MIEAPERVQQIVTDLQEEIRRYQALNEVPPPGMANPGLMRDVRARQWVNSHLPIGWPEMPRGLVPKLDAYAKKITRRLLRWYINPIVEQQNAFNAAVAEALGSLNTEIAGIERVSLGLQGLRQDIQVSQAVTRLRLHRLENWHRSGIPQVQELAESQRPAAGFDYFLLGAHYRNEAQAERWLGDYADLFDALLRERQGSHGVAGPVLDVGCGRGQLVAWLNAKGIPAYGIDLDGDAVEVGRSLGRDVRQAEAFSHLEGLEDDSMAAVVMLQVIEHLDAGALAAMFAGICRKLAPGGFLIAETINPTCWYAMSNWYLLDPSHRQPVHPQLAGLMLEQAGFHRLEMRYLHPVPETERLAPLAGDGTISAGLLRDLNANIEHLNEVLFGPQDYAVIAFKPPE